MITLILAIILGITFALLSAENTQSFQFNLLGNIFTLPLYMGLILSFSAGVITAILFSLFDLTASAFDMRKKERNYKNAIRINEDLRNDIDRLKEENLKLKDEIETSKIAKNEIKKETRRQNIKKFFHKITHPNSPSHPHYA